MEKVEDVQTQKKNKGRQKIRIEPIISKSKQQVTFTKRRGGLFKKASDLCRLSGSEVAIITFSGAGKLFPFGHHNAEAVINRYLNHCSSKPNNNDHNNGYNYHVGTHSNKRGCEFWWDEPIDNLGLSELEKLKSAVEGLRNRVALKVDKANHSAMNYSAPQELCSGFGLMGGDPSAPEDFSLALIKFGSSSGSMYSAPQELCSSLMSQDNIAPDAFSLASINFGSGSDWMDQSLAPQVNGFTMTHHGGIEQVDDVYPSHESDSWLDLLLNSY